MVNPKDLTTTKPIWSASLPIQPYPKGRPRFTTMGRSYTPAKTRKAEQAIKALCLLLQPSKPILGPLTVTIEFVLVKPKSVSKKRLFPHVRPDLDNYAKLVLDVLQPEIIQDDSQVCQLHLTKTYGDAPMIGIKIFSME